MNEQAFWAVFDHAWSDAAWLPKLLGVRLPRPATEPPHDETPHDEPPHDEPPHDEPPHDEPPHDELTDDELTDDELMDAFFRLANAMRSFDEREGRAFLVTWHHRIDDVLRAWPEAGFSTAAFVVASGRAGFEATCTKEVAPGGDPSRGAFASLLGRLSLALDEAPPSSAPSSGPASMVYFKVGPDGDGQR